MRVLIAGGSGFLGRALSERLLADGADVVWLSRSPRGLRTPAKVAVRTYDALSADEAFDAVFNLAGAGIADRRWSDRRKRVLRDSRLTPTRRLIEWMQRAPRRPRVLLSGSAVGWYGVQGDAALTEDSAPRDDFAHALCAEWEAAAKQAEALGVATVLLRTGIALHPDGGMLKRVLPPFRLGLGGRLGDGRQILSWIDRDDWVAAAHWLMRAHLDGDAARALRGAVNLTAPTPVDNAEFTAALAAALRRPAPLPVPAAALKLALGEMSTLLLEGQRVLPKRLQDAGFAFRYPRIDDALQARLR